MDNEVATIHAMRGLVIALFLATGARFSGKLFIPATVLASIYLLPHTDTTMGTHLENRHTIKNTTKAQVKAAKNPNPPPE